MPTYPAASRPHPAAAPKSTFRHLLVQYGRGVLYGPFNAELQALQSAVAELG